MDYATVVTAFLQPPDGTPADPAVVGGRRSAARVLRDAVEPLAMQAVWARAANERYEALGLDFLTGYVWGRAAALGADSPAALVVSTFAVFEPGMLTALLTAGRAACAAEQVLAARRDGAAEAVATYLAGEDLGPTADELEAALAQAEPMGRPLYAALSALPEPALPGQAGAAARLWRACERLRELRGDGHVAACVAAGLSPVEANVLTELWLGMPVGAYTASRGWSETDVAVALAGLQARGWHADGGLTDAGRTARERVEDATDDSVATVAAAVRVGTVERLHVWSGSLVAARSFPADPSKRAAG